MMHSVELSSNEAGDHPIHTVDIAILGGGVAGLATVLGLRQRGIDAVVFERSPAYDLSSGKGFLLMPNGIDALAQLGLDDAMRAVSHGARRAIHHSPDGKVLRDTAIPEHLGILRSSVLDVLLGELPSEAVRTNMTFTGFSSSGERKVACFAGGERVAARVFVGADGINSKVRRLLFGEPLQRLTPICELVAAVDSSELAAGVEGRLHKIEDRPQRRILGLFSVGGDRILWYLRWHRHDLDLTELSPEAKKAGVSALTRGWPELATALIDATDFSQSVVLDSVLIELPPRFSNENVVLIGDAAHPLVRLTTQGVNSALEDAVILTDLLADQSGNIEHTLNHFSTRRLADLRELLEEGPRKVDAFIQGRDTYGESIGLAPNAPSDLSRAALERLAAWNDQHGVPGPDYPGP